MPVEAISEGQYSMEQDAVFNERMVCPVCDGTDIFSVYSRPMVGSEVEAYLRPMYDRMPRPQSFSSRFRNEVFEVCECKICRAYFHRFIPTDDFASEYYSTWATGRSRPKWGFGEYTHRINEALILTSFLLKHMKKSSPSDLSILDFGLGRGRFALAMRACGCRVSAMDIAPDHEAEAQANGLTIVKPGEISGSDFDFINTEQVFEHLPKPRDTARELLAGIRSGGILKISVPYARWLEKKQPIFIDWNASRYDRGSSMPVQPLEHLNYFRRPSLHIMMREMGCSEVKFGVLEELNYAFDWKGFRNIAKNLVRPIARSHFRNYFLFAKD